MEEKTYLLMSEVMRDADFAHLGEKIKQRITRASLVSLSEDILETDRIIAEDCMTYSYSDRMRMLAGKMRTGEWKSNECYDTKRIFPDFENQLLLKEPIVVTPLNFDRHLYGYYATHYGNIMDHAGEMFWTVRTLTMALNLVLDRRTYARGKEDAHV